MAALLLRCSGMGMSVVARRTHFLSSLPLHKKGVGLLPEDYFDDKVVLLYFSSSWCKSCKLFTPKLKGVYDEAVSSGDKSLQIVWISRDRTASDLTAYYEKKLPAWPYLPFGDQNIPGFLDKYSIKTIPAIRLVNEIGDVVSDDIRMQIENAEPGDSSSLVTQWAALVANKN